MYSGKKQKATLWNDLHFKFDLKFSKEHEILQFVSYQLTFTVFVYTCGLR